MPVLKRPLLPFFNPARCSAPFALFFRKFLSVTCTRNRLRLRARLVHDAKRKGRCREDHEASTTGSSAIQIESVVECDSNTNAVVDFARCVAQASSAAPPSFATIKESQALISRFHTVQKYVAAAEVDRTLTQQARDKRVRELKAELEALGGLPAYQQASLFGATAEESGAFNSGVWVYNELHAMNLLPPADGHRRLRLLDVGALQDHWSAHEKLVHAVAIDLNPQHPNVRRADFFDFPPVPPAGAAAFDALVLSLVLNFVGDPRRRGVMLERCAALLPQGGALFIVIPAACITNSRYMNHVLFVRILHAVGFELSRHKITPKLALYALRRSDCCVTGDEMAGLGCRRLCRTGTQRNNFSVLIGGEWGLATAGNRSKLKPTAAILKNIAAKNK